MGICVFTGHRQLPEDPAPLAALLDEAIEKLCRAGVTEYLCGGACGFDLLAGERVLALRPRLPELRLHLMLPCGGQDRHFSAQDKRRYAALLRDAQQQELLSPVYYSGCMLARDRRMVALADVCVCYLAHSGGGTAYTVGQAVKKGISVYNLATRL